MESDNVTFYAWKTIKVKPGFNLKQTGGANIHKTAEVFFKYK